MQELPGSGSEATQRDMAAETQQPTPWSAPGIHRISLERTLLSTGSFIDGPDSTTFPI